MLEFGPLLLKWFACSGRKNLPWQHPKTAYRVWVSEIMLQQTQVQTVIPYFIRFIQQFPSVEALANGHEEEVLRLWSGLGYYSRARNLHKTAKIIAFELDGQFPDEPQALVKLPGIGPSTAAAITSLAFNKPTPILDANVMRVLCRYFAVEEDPKKARTKKKLWELAKLCMPLHSCAQYTQAIMDFGATLCTPQKPQCGICPFALSCLAKQQGKVNILPYKQARKSLPTHSKTFLLLHRNNQEIYLEKNPPTGIWGGLWSMPIFGGNNLEEFLGDNFSYKPIEILSLCKLKHSFSHYHLSMEIISIEIAPLENYVKEVPGKWISIEKTKEYGLPQPIRSVIETWCQIDRV
ncbi:A/G-specific adenine glycosylase (plasmid) [Legionella adelaidensis]|uniref:Adenine DNA glycosylase n=1 Tax=Legionella adelaidensis TaxID=45056 RepID=A0A0W0R1D5_9GAMM|nr:A/G-specific adenine glycosylase [Legionella adelaidensis]KTC64916.1 A/G specific adenine glycosylase [Legionella adelaidensis]VEH85599.1 A/G-specific adenine glycosylase [Legionella adelaidensis]